MYSNFCATFEKLTCPPPPLLKLATYIIIADLNWLVKLRLFRYWQLILNTNYKWSKTKTFRFLLHHAHPQIFILKNPVLKFRLLSMNNSRVTFEKVLRVILVKIKVLLVKVCQTLGCILLPPWILICWTKCQNWNNNANISLVSGT